MGRKRLFDKKIPMCFSISPITVKELDEFIGEESRSQLAEDGIRNEIRRRRGLC